MGESMESEAAGRSGKRVSILTQRSAARGDAPGSTGSSFHYSFTLLPRERRRAIEAVYGFCRVVDDLADEAASSRDAQAGLYLFRDELVRCYDGAPTLPVTRGLQEHIRRFRIPREPFEAILEGVEMDLHKRRYADFAELRGYCVRVASAVGLVCLPIFGATHPKSRDYATDLGLALQLTNILRDLKGDAARGRIYLPQDEMEHFGYHEQALLRGDRSTAFLALMRYQADRADRHFEAAAAALPDSDRRALLPAEVMGAIYRRLLRRMRDERFPVFERRVAVPRLTQVRLTLAAWVTGRVGA
ncbi:MAG TPA: presqualene diphosphate synthase HpnD [Verrucomicrobiae bacterium]|nr:presqualene diphosphate synthase HpnD [Verrucomicrobiae bacterium]